MDADNILVGAATVQIDSEDVGYTMGGVTVRFVTEATEVIADQAMGVVAKRRQLERLYVVVPFLEVTLDRIREAFNQPESNLNGGTLTLGYNDSCSINEHEIVLTGVGPDCSTRVFTFSRCVAFGEFEYSMSREEATVFEVEFECLKDASGHFGTVVDAS